MSKWQGADRLVEKVSKHLKDNSLTAVPFDKGAGFCIMKETGYNTRLQKVFSCRQFTELQTEGSKPLAIKIEEDLNQELLSLFRAGRISERFYNEVPSTGGTPPRLYGLAKVHKKDTPLRPVLSLPGSIYYNLNRKLSMFFQDIAGAKI